jgi:hypothetical protein
LPSTPAICAVILQLPARVLVIQAAQWRYWSGTVIPDAVLPVSSGDRAIRCYPGSHIQTGGGSWWSGGAQLSVITLPRRMTGTSRRPPFDWLHRGPDVRRPRVTSSRPAPRPRSRRTPRHASGRETPNAVTRGCVRRHGTRRDVFNVLNNNAVLAVQTRYGATFLTPQHILPGRFVKIGARLKW